MKNDTILLSHGSGGKMSDDLITDIFRRHFSNNILNTRTDSAVLSSASGSLAFTTDTYVVDPIFFPGGNIGNLAVCGTINDLAVSGAVPKYLSTGFILEEGLPIRDLEVIASAMGKEAKEAGVQIVTGDTKVVKRGQCDKIFINTSGIGILNPEYTHISSGIGIEPGDKILINGEIGNHGIAILGARENLTFEHDLISDVSSLHVLIQEVLQAGIEVKFMRDLTRGGLATVLAEVTEDKDYGITAYEEKIPVNNIVKGLCELYGFEALYLANEGKVMMVTKGEHAEKTCDILRNHPLGKHAEIIGEITSSKKGKAVMESLVGGHRIIDKLTGEQLPRIC